MKNDEINMILVAAAGIGGFLLGLSQSGSGKKPGDGTLGAIDDNFTLEEPSCLTAGTYCVSTGNGHAWCYDWQMDDCYGTNYRTIRTRYV